MSDQDQQPDHTHPALGDVAAGPLAAPLPEVTKPRKKPGRRAFKDDAGRSARQVKEEALRLARLELPEPAAFDVYQAAVFVGLSTGQLENLRTDGGGPKFFYHGRHVRYLRTKLLEWLESKPSYENTAQVPEGEDLP